MIKRIGILTGGGDVAPLNAAIAAAAEEAAARGIELVGLLHGWRGALEGRFVDLAARRVDPRIGGTILKSSRLDLGAAADGPRRVLDRLARERIGGLIVIGGDDTLSTSFLLPSLPQVLISKTIDNDVGQWPSSDAGFEPAEVLNYFTLGFPTAARKIISYVSLDEGLRTTAYSHGRIVFVESMGMHAGWLALSSSLGHPDIIIVPEFPVDYKALLGRVARRFEEQGHLIVVVAEGARYSDGAYIRAEEDVIGNFGHPRFGGAAEALRDRVRSDLSGRFSPRNINVVNPSYLYRSGAPDRLDRSWAAALGRRAVRILAEGTEPSLFLALHRIGERFRIREHPLSRFTSMGDLHRFVDASLYDPENLAATELGLRYFREFLPEIAFDGRYGVRE